MIADWLLFLLFALLFAAVIALFVLTFVFPFPKRQVTTRLTFSSGTHSPINAGDYYIVGRDVSSPALTVSEFGPGLQFGWIVPKNGKISYPEFQSYAQFPGQANDVAASIKIEVLNSHDNTVNTNQGVAFNPQNPTNASNKVMTQEITVNNLLATNVASIVQKATSVPVLEGDTIYVRMSASIATGVATNTSWSGKVHFDYTRDK